MSEQKKPQMSVVSVNELIQRGDFAMLPGCDPKPVTELTGAWVGDSLFCIRSETPFDHPSHVMVILRKAEPEPDPDEWVTQDRVRVRPGIDEITWATNIMKPDRTGGWCGTRTGSTSDGKWHGHKLDNLTVLSVRCRRKDLPPIPEPKPATQTIVFHEVIRTWDDYYEREEKVLLLTANPGAKDVKTGRTETREVVR